MAKLLSLLTILIALWFFGSLFLAVPALPLRVILATGFALIFYDFIKA